MNVNIFIGACLYLLSLIFVYKIAYRYALNFDSRSSVYKDRVIFYLKVRLAIFTSGEGEYLFKIKCLQTELDNAVERRDYFETAFNDCFYHSESLYNKLSDQQAYINRLNVDIEMRKNLIKRLQDDINAIRRQHHDLRAVFEDKLKLTYIQENDDNERH